jgi:hypothetical protein
LAIIAGTVMFGQALVNDFEEIVPDEKDDR